ncbi:hypothetical protein CesoFtcFv8_017010 [Champsocephalus esox]|uniref:Uncharacterized protein n=1 Tax=Champsocephalus esox TaxID=159716 RepID=A0AAN8GNM7_9TELE|nr:hypothetical protein CesoFtcFv8_017010 [Champsocephalus esox]
MDMNNVRRVSSAGYRLPERTRPKTTEPPADRGRLGTGAAGPGERNPERRDPVKQDQVWKELVWGERRGVREWEKNWHFLRDYDQMGRLKPEEPLPSNVPLFSERVSQHHQPDVWQQAVHSSGQQSGPTGPAAALVWKQPPPQAGPRDAALLEL